MNNLRFIIVSVLPRLSDIGLAELNAAVLRQIKSRQRAAVIAKNDVMCRQERRAA